MNFNPNEIKELEYLTVGKYEVKVSSMERTISTKGSDMLTIIYEDIRTGGKTCKDFLVASEKSFFKWRNAWRATGYEITDPQMNVEKMMTFLNDDKLIFRITIKERKEIYVDQNTYEEKTTTRPYIVYVPYEKEERQEINHIEINLGMPNDPMLGNQEISDDDLPF